MSYEFSKPCADWKDVIVRLSDYFFYTIKVFIIGVTVVICVYLLLFALTSGSSDKAFEMEQSRLAKQLDVVLSETNGYSKGNLTAEQRLQICQELVKHYDASNDSLKPVKNEHAQPGVSMIEILSHFKISKDGKSVQLIKEIDTGKNDKEWK